MIKLKDLLLEMAVDVMKILDGIMVMSDSEFDKNGGWNVSIGSGGKLYTLRHDHWDTIGVYEGGKKIAIPIRRSYFVRSLGKEWEDALVKLSQVAKQRSISKIFIPSYDGKLRPNKKPTPITIPDKFWFGKHSGLKIEEVAKDNVEYLFWMSINFKPANSNKKMAGFLQKVREFLGDERIEKYVKKKEDEKTAKEKTQKERGLLLQPIIDVIDAARKSFHKYRGEDTESEEWIEADKKELWGDFTSSVLYGLKRGELPKGRGLSILADIYAKNVGGKRNRRNSKAYKDGLKEFDLFVDDFLGESEMKKSELRQMIREEIRGVISEREHVPKPFAVIDVGVIKAPVVISVHKTAQEAKVVAKKKPDYIIKILRVQVDPGETLDRNAVNSLRGVS